MYTLYIGNRNYSSWSLRGWLAMRLAGAPFRVERVLLGAGQYRALRAVSPSARVPVLHDDATIVWDSLAIAEYLAERHPGLWPDDPGARAFARCASAEMHSGFGALRAGMTMCIRERVDVRPWSEALARDIGRIEELWCEGRSRFSADGPFLCGRFSVADAFFAPVAFRFRTYGVTLREPAQGYAEALLAQPWVREWDDAALAETEVISQYEPRVAYRDKLAGSSAGDPA